MAGDLRLKEEVVVLGSRAEEFGTRAARSMERGGGRVLHQFGPRVMVMEMPEISADSALEGEAASAYATEPTMRLAAATRRSLDVTGQLGYQALRLRQRASFQRAKANRPLESQAWDVSEAQRPDSILAEEAFTAPEAPLAADMPSASPTSAFLIGSTAVGLIIVEGPTEDLKFSDDQRAKVVAEVQNGLSWLATLEPKANVSWSYDIQIVTLDVAPANLPKTELEAHWRDPAMGKLGYGGGLNNVLAYVQDLRSRLATRWGYCAFFTKYPTAHFAYASLGGPRLVMQYDNDGWGPDNIDRVFAHESGHIFGASDEYASSGCNCGGQWGYLKAPNGNCVNCADQGGVACIMRANEWAMCDYTRTHIGWRDQDNDGVLDPDDPLESPRWWLFRWLCRRYPDLCRFLQAPPLEDEEDLVPISLLAQVLKTEDMDNLKTRIQQEQDAYLRSIAQDIEEASTGLRNHIRRRRGR
ncbi:MAG: hypothetical protein JXA78_18495 [Anaerolineales bacterium]|nr:hypothetical protein [Anaerolineales bacterium]